MAWVVADQASGRRSLPAPSRWGCDQAIAVRLDLLVSRADFAKRDLVFNTPKEFAVGVAGGDRRRTGRDACIRAQASL